MRFALAALSVCLSLFGAVSAHAACSDAYYNSTRASRINAVVASMPSSGALVIIGDSHVEAGLEVKYGQGQVTVGSSPVYFLGSSGGTWQTIRDCIPWSSIAAKSPANIIIQANVNDTVTGQCCGGATVSADGTAAYAQVIMGAINSARAIVANPVIATDPPPESGAGIDGYTNHSSARIVYYVATLCGGTCSWSTFGWGGSAPSSPMTFVDQYKLMAGSSCTGSEVGYPTSIVGCTAASGTTRDNVHFPSAGVATMYGNLIDSIP